MTMAVGLAVSKVDKGQRSEGSGHQGVVFVGKVSEGDEIEWP